MSKIIIFVMVVAFIYSANAAYFGIDSSGKLVGDWAQWNSGKVPADGRNHMSGMVMSSSQTVDKDGNVVKKGFAMTNNDGQITKYEY